MKLMKLMKLASLFLDSFFPPRCIGCGLLNTPWCEHCLATIQRKQNQECYICRRTSTGGITCPEHLDRPERLNRLFVACPYDANPLLKKAIHALKYEKRSKVLAEPLGGLLAMTLAPIIQQFSNRVILIPVPLHHIRQRERGFNQAELLAQSLAVQFSPPLPINHDLLIRTRPTLSQAESKTREERIQNLKNAFTVGFPPPRRARMTKKAKVYLLLDDVCATAATLEDTCRALRESGVKEVLGMVVARN